MAPRRDTVARVGYARRLQLTRSAARRIQRAAAAHNRTTNAALGAVVMCALLRRALPAGGSTPPGKLSLQPEALGAAHEVTT